MMRYDAMGKSQEMGSSSHGNTALFGSIRTMYISDFLYNRTQTYAHECMEDTLGNSRQYTQHTHSHPHSHPHTHTHTHTKRSKAKCFAAA